MKWIIARSAEEKQTLIARDRDGVLKAVIRITNSGRFVVHFPEVQQLNENFGSQTQAIGYVRGVEATVNLYAKETGRK